MVLVTLLALGLLAAPAQAAFPGANGKIAYMWFEGDSTTQQICTINPNGTGETCLTSIQALAEEPAWSSDGQKIVWWISNLVGDIVTMNADGSNQQSVRSNAFTPSWSPASRDKIVFVEDSGGLATIDSDGTGFAPLTSDGSDGSPNWSPDGFRIAFTRTTGGNREIYAISPDTGQETRLTNTAVSELSPDWSPDGSNILFSAGGQLHTMNADGSDRTPLPVSGVEPSWSPDGQKIVYRLGSNIYIANADGTGQTLVPTNPCCPAASFTPDWQPLPVSTPSTHVRPAGATPFRVPLVPAFDKCTAGNRTHGPPLVYPSCAPPQAKSPNLTVGVGDGDPALSRSVGFVRLRVDPGTPGGVDDTDVRIRLSLSNVMRVSDLSEYTGELRASAQVRLTDRLGTVSQTTVGFPLEFDVPCTPTAATLDKSLCDVATTLDAVTPGAAAEGTRAVWALDQLRVYDGGPDEDADTTADNSLFATQGVFVP
jgi:hypothetical protein